MSYNAKKRHINELIERLHRQFKFNDIFEDEIKEWVYESIRLLGSPEILIHDNTSVYIDENSRAMLPDNMILIHQVYERSTGRILHLSTNEFDISDAVSFSNSDNTMVVHATTVDGKSMPDPEDENNPFDVTIELNNSTSIVELIPTDSLYNIYVYYMQNGYIYTPYIKNSTIVISHTSFPLNDDGTPAIPDDETVFNFILWFCAERIALRLWMANEISEHIYRKIEQERLFYTSSAKNRITTNSIPEMENFKNMWQRFIQNPYHYNSGFKYLTR